MKGVNALTGKVLEGEDYRRQCINTVLTTPIGSLSFMRSFGSRLFELIDEPLIEKTQILAFSYCSESLKRWVPNIRLDKTKVLRRGSSLIIELSYDNTTQNVHIGV